MYGKGKYSNTSVTRLRAFARVDRIIRMDTCKNLRMLILGLLPILALVFLTNLYAEDASLLKAQFKEIRETSFGTYGIYTITNVGQRDIDDVILYLYLKDKNGDTLSSMAVTDSTPGLVWLKAGESSEQGVPLDRSKAARVLLETNPDEGNFVIEVKNMTFMNQ